MYNPKPAKYEEGNAFCLTRYNSWDIRSNLIDIISDVSKCLLYHLTDTPYENKYLHGCGLAEMKRDPYLVWHRISNMDYSYKAPELASLKDLIVNKGRATGLWTLHGKSGNNVGVAGNDFLIRINPEAWSAILGVLSQSNSGLDLISVSRPSPENPGWRRVPWYNVKEGTSTALYKLLKQGAIQVKKGNGDYFLMKDAKQSKEAQVRDHMEHLISKYDLMELSGTDPDGWLVKAMFPNVPSELVVRNYMTYAIQESLERELKNKEAQLAKEIQEVRELRKVSRSFHNIGGWDGLLTAMGKDIQDNLVLHATDWARGIKDDEESRFTTRKLSVDSILVACANIARFTTRKLSDALTKMARDYLEGTIEFPEE